MDTTSRAPGPFPTSRTVAPPRWVAATVKTGLVLAAVMALFNCINGLGSAIDPRFGQVDPALPPQPLWVSLMLLGFGLVTLAAVVPAWRGLRRATWVVVLSRLGEAWSSFLLLLVPGLPARDVWLLIAVLVPLGTLVAGMVALSLRRW